jgi:hypothetical protein
MSFARQRTRLIRDERDATRCYSRRAHEGQGENNDMSNYDPRSLLATSPMTRLQILVCTITVLLNALDGFDLLAISFATPGIMKDFQIPPDEGLGLVLAMDLWGMAVGSFVLGGVADYVGRRRAILSFLVVMTACISARTPRTSTNSRAGASSPALASAACSPRSTPPRRNSRTTRNASSGSRS